MAEQWIPIEGVNDPEYLNWCKSIMDQITVATGFPPLVFSGNSVNEIINDCNQESKDEQNK